MNANLRKPLQNPLALIVLPALSQYLTQNGKVHLVDAEHAYRKGHAAAWLFNEFGVAGVCGGARRCLDCLPVFSHSFISGVAAR